MTADDFLSGQILCIDKPLEWTSFQAVNSLKWAIRKKYHLKKIKIGHAGTLDPLATGLLLVCTGKFTKRIPELQGQVKEYTGTFTIGATTPSYDLETEVNATYAIDHITTELIKAKTEGFIGEIDQVPPIFSALKKDGKRLYELARAGETTTIPSRKVHIHEFEITYISLPQIGFRVLCGKGTYIRSLAHDYGKALGAGAYLSELRRTKIGDFIVDKAISPADFKNQLEQETP